MNTKIEIKEISELNVAGITHIGINGIENVFDRLLKWSKSKSLLNNSKVKLGRIFYDSFKVTSPEKVRINIFLKTNQSFESEGEINKITINKGKHVVSHFEITLNDFEKSWTSLFI